MTNHRAPDPAPPSCAEQLRRRDRDRYLTALFAPAGRRGALLALYAVNLALAEVRARVSEPLLGEVRLQWWRDTIEAIYHGKPVRGPEAAQALAATLDAAAIPQALFERLIDARIAALYEPAASDPPYADEAEAGGALGELALAVVLGAPGDDAVRTAADHVGRARALAGLAGDAARPLATDQRRALATRAQAHLDRAREHAPRIARPALAPFLLAPLAESDIACLKRAAFEPARAAFQRAALGRQIRLWWAAARAIY